MANISDFDIPFKVKYESFLNYTVNYFRLCCLMLRHSSGFLLKREQRRFLAPLMPSAKEGFTTYLN